MLFTIAFGGAIVPKLNLVLTLICRQYLADKSLHEPGFQFMPVLFGADNPQCQIPEVQALVARFSLYCNLIPGVLSAITSPKLGALSDRYGRTKIIALTSLGLVFSEVLTILAATWPDRVSVYWLLVGQMLDGLCGSFIVAIALTHSYAADCTPPARRNEAFGYFHGALFTGIAVGPIVAGYLVEAVGSILSVFYIALLCHLIFLTVLVFVVPESLSRERQLTARAKHRAEKVEASPWSLARLRDGANVFVPLDILFPTGEGASRALRMNLVLLAAVDTIMFGVAMGSMSVVVYYSEFVFGWGNLQSSIFVSVVNTSRVVVLVILLPLLTRVVRGRRGRRVARNSGSDAVDLAIIRVAVLFDTLGYLGYTLAHTGTMFIMSGAVAAIGSMGSPTLQSALTKHVPPDRTGQLLGAVGLLHALARVVAPTIFNLIYEVTVGTTPQTVFVCLTATFGSAFLLSWFIRPHGSHPPSRLLFWASRLTATVYLDDPDARRPRRLAGHEATEDEEEA